MISIRLCDSTDRWLDRWMDRQIDMMIDRYDIYDG